MLSWKRIATFVAGGAAIVVGVLVPPAAVYLVPAGVGMLGLATRWPEDRALISAARAHGVRADGQRVDQHGNVHQPPIIPPPRA